MQGQAEMARAQKKDCLVRQSLFKLAFDLLNRGFSTGFAKHCGNLGVTLIVGPV